MLLADSIVPWASEWLFFYEFWLVTGEWDGGGRWQPTSAPESPADQAGGLSQNRRRGGELMLDAKQVAGA
jgi:hypothetical protein